MALFEVLKWIQLGLLAGAALSHQNHPSGAEELIGTRFRFPSDNDGHGPNSDVYIDRISSFDRWSNYWAKTPKPDRGWNEAPGGRY